MMKEHFMGYRIAICDDEVSSIAELRGRIADILAESGLLHEMETFTSGESFYEAFRKDPKAFDIIFLDILMGEINGMDTAKAVRGLNETVSIVFTTSSDKYVFAGYDVQALQYIIKPVQKEGLEKVLSRDLKRFRSRNFNFRNRGNTYSIPFADILYFESALKNVKLVTRQGTYELTAKITDLEGALPGSEFFRCHRGFIVNLKHVSKMNTKYFILPDEEEIPIGKTYHPEAVKVFLDYIGQLEKI